MILINFVGHGIMGTSVRTNVYHIRDEFQASIQRGYGLTSKQIKGMHHELSTIVDSMEKSKDFSKLVLCDARKIIDNLAMHVI